MRPPGRPLGSPLRDAIFEHVKHNPGLAVCEIAAALDAPVNRVLRAMDSFKAQHLAVQVGERQVARAQGGVMTYPGWKLVDGEATRRPSKMNDRELGRDVQHVLLGLGRAVE